LQSWVTLETGDQIRWTVRRGYTGGQLLDKLYKVLLVLAHNKDKTVLHPWNMPPVEVRAGVPLFPQYKLAAKWDT